MYRFFAVFSIFLVLLVSCKKDPQYGYIRLVIEHYWGEEPVKIDGTTQYTNAAGNVLTFDRLEYFISDLTLHGPSQLKVEHPNIRYITMDTAYSILLLTYQFETGHYNTISFTFGLNEEKNQSNIFPNSPQRDMFWPDNMGGGYHYMKLDGKWENKEGIPTPFGLHLGALETIIRYDTTYRYDTTFGLRETTQQRDSIIKIDTTVIETPIWRKFHNYFPVSIARNFTVEHNKITTDTIIMDIKQWMQEPFRWDFDLIGGAIMSNRFALDSLRINGYGGGARLGETRYFPGTSVFR